MGKGEGKRRGRESTSGGWWLGAQTMRVAGMSEPGQCQRLARRKVKGKLRGTRRLRRSSPSRRRWFRRWDGNYVGRAGRRGSITTETPHGRSVIKMGITFPAVSFRKFAPTVLADDELKCREKFDQPGFFSEPLGLLLFILAISVGEKWNGGLKWKAAVLHDHW